MDFVGSGFPASYHKCSWKATPTLTEPMVPVFQVLHNHSRTSRCYWLPRLCVLQPPCNNARIRFGWFRSPAAQHNQLSVWCSCPWCRCQIDHGVKRRLKRALHFYMTSSSPELRHGQQVVDLNSCLLAQLIPYVLTVARPAGPNIASLACTHCNLFTCPIVVDRS